MVLRNYRKLMVATYTFDILEIIKRQLFKKKNEIEKIKKRRRMQCTRNTRLCLV